MASKILVVDDSALVRKVVSEVLSNIPGVEVVGTASNGRIALKKIEDLKPDIMVLDIEMPEMNGFEVLSSLRRSGIGIDVIILSAYTEESSYYTLRALQLGAFDFITKPSSHGIDELKGILREKIEPMLITLGRKSEIKGILRGRKHRPDNAAGVTRIRGNVTPPDSAVYEKQPSRQSGYDIVLIGISTGGPAALHRMLPMLGERPGGPIFIVQHMPQLFTETLAKDLNGKSGITVKEAADREIAEPNTAYLAPGGTQMRIVREPANGRIMVRITNDPPENSCKPSADYLFRSAAEIFPGRAVAVIMTGMGADGVEGLRLLAKTGSRIIAQDEETCVVFGMPREAINARIVDVIAPLDNIAAEILKALKK
jgi:two-component system chemotaxis response regulator CheB